MTKLFYFIPFLLLLLSINGISQPEVILVEAGEFVMGCTDEQKPNCDGDETPVHAVRISKLYAGKYEVTQAEWMDVMGDNPSGNTACGTLCPVENIDWYSLLVFCNEQTLASTGMDANDLVYFKDEDLTLPWSINDYKGDGDTGGDNVFMAPGKEGYRLPTEAEWEFLARGGSLSQGYKYSGSNDADAVGWYKDNAEESIHPVGMKDPNELGLYDMTGNVWERVWDFKGDYLHPHQCDPSGVEEGTERIYRGGAFYYSINYCRTADRYFNKPTRASSNIGFRVVRTFVEM